MPTDEEDNVTRIVNAKSADAVKVDGKTVTPDGLVTRSGRRRVFTDTSDFTQEHDDMLRDLAAQELRGRRLEIFKALVLDAIPDGDKAAMVASLAKKYGVPAARIYRELHVSKERLKMAIEQRVPRAHASSPGGACPTCGRLYDHGAIDPWAVCKRGYSGLCTRLDRRFVHEIHPECLSPAERSQLVRRSTKFFLK
jgi:hypothetical protein